MNASPRRIAAHCAVLAIFSCNLPALSHAEDQVNPEFSDHIQRGETLFRNGQYDQEITELSDAISIDPSNSLPYVNRAVAYRNLGRLPQAIADLTKAIELGPESTYAPDYDERENGYLLRGEIYLMWLKQYNNAIADFDKVVELNPNNADAICKRGFSYAELGQYEKAIQDYSRALQLKPGDQATLNNLGYAREQLARSRPAIPIQTGGPSTRAPGDKFTDLPGAIGDFARASQQNNVYDQALQQINERNLAELRSDHDRAAAAGSNGLVVLGASGAHVWSTGEIVVFAMLVVALAVAIGFIIGNRSLTRPSDTPPKV